MIKQLFHTQTKSLGAASFILGAAYLLSAFLGFLRDRILASSFGAGQELDIYYAAFRLPDLVATIFIFGAVTAAIIPVFSGYLAKSASEAWRFAANLFNLFLLILVPVCLLLIVLAPLFISWVAPGFSQAQQDLTVDLLRIMFLSPVLLGLSNILSGILQVFRRFLVTALAPILYNLGIIFGAVVLAPLWGLWGLAWGVVIGAFLHLLIQIPSFWLAGFRPIAIYNFREKGFTEVLKLMAPRSLGLAAGQINLIVITALASGMSCGAITVFTLASNLAGTLTNLVAVSLATAVFPALSLAFAQKETKQFISQLSLIIRGAIFLLCPLSFFLFVLREPAVRFIFGAGRFDSSDIQLTAACLGIFSLGILAQGLILVVLKAFYALHNTKLPALVSLGAVLINAGLSLGLIKIFQQDSFLTKFFGAIILQKQFLIILALPLAFSLTAIIQLFLLGFFLHRQIGDYDLLVIGRSTVLILISGFLAGLSSWWIFSQTAAWGWFGQGLIAGLAGLAIYLFLSWLWHSPELKAVSFSITRKR
jgi:putative peptidoglycan lipid II flippase